jgi:hypothetical protein
MRLPASQVLKLGAPTAITMAMMTTTTMVSTRLMPC